jgi:hypothetical protein
MGQEPEDLTQFYDEVRNGDVDLDSSVGPSDRFEGDEVTVAPTNQSGLHNENNQDDADAVIRFLGEFRDALNMAEAEKTLGVIQRNTRQNYEEDQDPGYHRFSVLRALEQGIDPQMKLAITDDTYEDTLREFEDRELVESQDGSDTNDINVKRAGRALIKGFSPILGKYEDETDGEAEVSRFLDSMVGFNTSPGEKLRVFYEAVETDKPRAELASGLSCSKKTVGNW